MANLDPLNNKFVENYCKEFMAVFGEIGWGGVMLFIHVELEQNG